MPSALECILGTMSSPVVAVSGGVDSVTLAAVAVRVNPDTDLMHAVSPAVPAEATARVQRLAMLHGWRLTLIDAGEFADPNYRANPVNRCFYCKTNLYGAIRARTERQILSGANLDDLGEYRPGLDAARAHGVRHPFVEAAMDKHSVRRMARELGLEDVAELPSSPCLSSRVESGIRIEPSTLSFVHGVEKIIAAKIRPATVRCRVRAAAVVIELDASALDGLDDAGAQVLTALIEAHPQRPERLPIHFERYRNGSAFLTGRAT